MNRPTVLAGLLSLVLALAAWAPPAYAFSLFGVCLVGECPGPASDALDVIDPHEYELELRVEPTEAEDIVRSASALARGEGETVPGAAGVITRAKGDYKRILAGFYDAGHYGPSISIRVESREAAGLRVGEELPRKSRVVVEVEAGPAYDFGEARIVNAAPPPADRDDRVAAPADEGFAPGERARATAVRVAGKLAVEAWRQQGHPKAKVAGREATAVHPERFLNVAITLDPGPYARFGDVLVQGTERMDPEFVAYMTGLPRGKEYDPDEIKRVQARLDRLGVFASRRIVEGEVDDDGLMPLDVFVQERKLRRIGAGATLSTLDGLGAETYWLHRNLFGRAESLRLEASVGGVGTATDDLEELDYGVAATFRKPGLFTPDTDLVLNAFARAETNETYREISTGGSALVEHFLTPRTTLRYGALAKLSEFEDAFGTRDFSVFSALGEGTFDYRDDKLDATEGWYALARAQPFIETQFSNTGVRLLAEARAYEDFGTRGRTVLAGRLKVGSVLSPPIDETPPDMLFLTGGGGSLRGYAFNSVGLERTVTDAAGNVASQTVGGRGLIEGSVELRQRFGKNFGAVAFVDAATVSADPLARFDETVRVGVGIGARYYTGLGPIRLDLAVPLNPGDDDGEFGLYVGIGHAF